MSPRKASLRVAHANTCRNAGQSSLHSLKGCRCQPSYYTFHRDADGKPHKGARVKDRQTADQSLRTLQRELDEGRAGIVRVENITFSDWADKYEDILRHSSKKPKTVDGYLQTLAKARKAFGTSLYLREIRPEHLRKFDNPKQTADTRLRYLRELGACLQTAISEDKGWLDRNPVPPFTKSLGIKKRRRGKAPYELSELPLLYAKLNQDDNKVYLYATKFAAEAGLRLREIAGLQWQDVTLLGTPYIMVREQLHEKYGAGTPKSNKVRRFRLTREAAQVLEDWTKIVGVQKSGRVFAFTPQMLEKHVEKARIAAKIPKLSPDPDMVDDAGKPLPRTFHSLRYSCAALMLNRGYSLEAVMATTGHSRQELTEMYGKQSREMLDAQYDRIENEG